MTDLALDSKLRNRIEKDSETIPDMSTEMRWQKHKEVSRKLCSTKPHKALPVLC